MHKDFGMREKYSKMKVVFLIPKAVIWVEGAFCLYEAVWPSTGRKHPETSNYSLRN